MWSVVVDKMAVLHSNSLSELTCTCMDVNIKAIFVVKIILIVGVQRGGGCKCFIVGIKMILIVGKTGFERILIV